jgi:ferritin-like metal-binding protein YciE
MGLVARKTQTLEDLFHNQLNILYELEIESRKTLRQMAESASDTAVREELSAAVKETELHAARLDELFASIDTKPDALSCGCVGGLLRDCRELTDGNAADSILDAALVAMAQMIQQNEIARYQTAHGWAQSLKHEKAGSLLKQTLDEETASSARLADLAATVNESAVQKLLA